MRTGPPSGGRAEIEKASLTGWGLSDLDADAVAYARRYRLSLTTTTLNELHYIGHSFVHTYDDIALYVRVY